MKTITRMIFKKKPKWESILKYKKKGRIVATFVTELIPRTVNTRGNSCRNGASEERDFCLFNRLPLFNRFSNWHLR